MFRAYYIPALSVLLIVLVMAFITYPRYLALLDSYQNMKEHELAFQENEAYLEDLRSMSQFVQRRESDVVKIHSSLPSDLDLPSVMAHVNSLAAANGFSMRRVEEFVSSPARLQESPDLQQHRVDLVLTGFYGDEGENAPLRNFLEGLERSARFFQIETVSVQEDRQLVTVGDTPAGVIVRMSLLFYSY